MNNFQLGRLATISLASLLFIACDDGSAGASGGNSGGSTGSSDTESNPGPSGTSTGADSNSNSNSGSSSTTAVDDTDSAGSSSTGVGDTDPGGSSSSGGATDSAESGSSSTGGGGGESSTGGSDSDSDSDSDSGLEICEAPGDLVPCDSGTTNPFNAIGLGCVGGPNTAIPIFNPIFAANDANTWRIAQQFGDFIDPGDGLPLWRPREGESMLVIGTGPLPALDANGALIEVGDPLGDATTNPSNTPLPAPLSPLPGSAGGAGGTPFVNCDLVNDCSDSLIDQWNLGGGNANDLIWFQFETPVPGGTYGFSFDFAYFSEEFPEYVDTQFNDMFVAWSNSESYTGNLCFVNDEPCTVTALWPADYQGGAAELSGTQFTNDGATGWYEAKGTVVPNEMLQLTFALFDMSDSSFDTTLLVDNFRWDCEGCTPSEVDPCIGIDPV
ncbi:MAG: choice-of-anchor L domain-containing protein [Nannocystales bacterium]